LEAAFAEVERFEKKLKIYNKNRFIGILASLIPKPYDDTPGGEC